MLERLTTQVTYRFEHQQMQEYYAAESVIQELLGLEAGAGRNTNHWTRSPRQMCEDFQVGRVNQSSWSEPFLWSRAIGTEKCASSGSGRQLVRATALLVVSSTR